MNLRVRLALEGNLADLAKSTHLRIAAGARIAAERHAARGKLMLREDARKGGLGDRVANAWRADVYPKSASVRTHSPAVQIYSNAPLIVTAFGQATTIRSPNGLYLAIPTEHTPRRGRRYATPAEVEVIFNQDLIFVPGRGSQRLAFVDAVRSRNKKTWRRATNARTGKQSRKAELVLMFVMVPQVRLRKRLDWQRIFNELSAEWPGIFTEEINKALSAGSN